MIRAERIQATLLDLLAIPSPCGFTDEVVHHISRILAQLGVDHELTRRGTIRARLPGNKPSPARAVVTHVDTLGAMVKRIGADGRIEVAPIGHWSSRFAEGVRVTVFADTAVFRGCLLPKVEWGVSRDRGVESVPHDWNNIELRLEAPVYSAADAQRLGIEPGNFIALDSSPEVLGNGYITARSIDNKAGTAAVLEAIRHIVEAEATPCHDTYVLFTINETTGAGMGGAVLPEVSELVTVDFASVESREKTPAKSVVLASGDASGPYDFHLNAHLHAIARAANIPLQQRHLQAFHSDAAAALVAGHDVRTAVIAYAGDASHSVERTHLDSLMNMSELIHAYVMSEPTFARDEPLTSAAEFSHQIDTASLPVSTRVPDTAAVIRVDRDADTDTDNVE
ncbi:MAG: M20/M25/M40 family metallo-hydrolase [Gammaproteobacteria bacterium]|jgi:putative aminopeptidase FrvX|nr:M20/M25/M40 family metallo-hydrolase [Gammaproteobacteria bacterium]